MGFLNTALYITAVEQHYVTTAMFLPGFQRRKFCITSHLISQHLVPQKPNTLHTGSAMDVVCKQTHMRQSIWEIFVVCYCAAQYLFFVICRMGKELQ